VRWLAHHVTWHMQHALAPMLFTEHDEQAVQRTSPVAAARVSFVAAGTMLSIGMAATKQMRPKEGVRA
jgi:hypothetical protein